jgi:hypothetical protein
MKVFNRTLLIMLAVVAVVSAAYQIAIHTDTGPTLA